MLITIHNSVVNALKSRSSVDQTEVTECLRRLATARQEGKHIVIADRETLKVIISCFDDDKLTQKIYNKILDNEVSYLFSYRSAVSRYIEVFYPCPETQLLSDQKTIRVRPSFFNDSETIQKTIVLSENLNDSSFYKLIGQVYLVKKKLKLSILCEHQGGGGDTISVAFSDIQERDKRFCLCIVDSDCKAPESALGQTAKAIQQVHNSNRHRTELYILDVREIENLIPTAILAELSLDFSQQKALKSIKSIDDSSVKEIRRFLDLKEGTSLSHIIKNREDKVKSFWQDKISIPNMTPESLCQECYDEWNCQKENCSCQISSGFGNKILESVIKWSKETTSHKIAEKITPSDPLSSEWDKLGQKIINWCLTKPPIRA